MKLEKYSVIYNGLSTTNCNWNFPKINDFTHSGIPITAFPSQQDALFAPKNVT